MQGPIAIQYQGDDLEMTLKDSLLKSTLWLIRFAPGGVEGKIICRPLVSGWLPHEETVGEEFSNY